MTALYRFKWFRKVRGGVWYFVRPIIGSDDVGEAYWVHRQPYRTELKMRKEVY